MGHEFTWLAMGVGQEEIVTMTEAAPGPLTAERQLGGRFRLDERISLPERLSGPCGPYLESAGVALWKATDLLLGRPVTIHTLPAGVPVPGPVVDAVRAAARMADPRLATVYDTDFGDPGFGDPGFGDTGFGDTAPGAASPYIVSEWTPGTHLEDLVLSGLPGPALAAAMIADAADAIAVAHRAGLPHLRLTPRSLRWQHDRGLKITGLGIDAALCGTRAADPVAADTRALARMLYALLTGYWPGEQGTSLPPAPRYKGRVCTPRQVRAGVPAILDAIVYRGLAGEAPDAPRRAQTPAGLSLALRGVVRPSYYPADPIDDAEYQARPTRRARHAKSRNGRQRPSIRSARLGQAAA
jgi:hypothetical protein